MSLILENISFRVDKAFILLLLISAFVFLCFNIIDILKGKEFKILIDMRRGAKSFLSLSYLIERAKAITLRDFLNHIVNNGEDPKTLMLDIEIDDRYLPNNSVYMKKR